MWELTGMDEDDLHVVPVNDLVEHELNMNCVCIPDVEIVEITVIYKHHSLDGRELHEKMGN